MSNNKWLESLSEDARNLYKEKLYARRRLRYATDAEWRSLFKGDKQQIRYQSKREAAIAYLGGRCADPRCGWINSDGTKGCTVLSCLQIDHVLGDGAKRRKTSGQEGSKLLDTVLRTLPGEIYQLLCANCNWIKRHENHELPQARHVDNSFVAVPYPRGKDSTTGRFLTARGGS
jgi:hypothetical protein